MFVHFMREPDLTIRRCGCGMDGDQIAGISLNAAQQTTIRRGLGQFARRAATLSAQGSGPGAVAAFLRRVLSARQAQGWFGLML